MKSILSFFLSVVAASTIGCVAFAQTTKIPVPSGSNQFGSSITILLNGNYTITDPNYGEPGKTNLGAVYLYNGKNHELISKISGTQSGDFVGNMGVTPLSNGNYVVISSLWNNGPILEAGAATFCNGITGLNGEVSESNSLVGSHVNDHVGSLGVTSLRNGNYSVGSSDWDNGNIVDAGAVTFGNGTTGTIGTVSPDNSLVGSHAHDMVGNAGIQVLSNKNYLIRSKNWNNASAANAGAVTWANGLSGIIGEVNSGNSLVGSSSNDLVGSVIPVLLANGNYVIKSPDWSNGALSSAGAVTWGDGSIGVRGEISTANSLVGSNFSDEVGTNITLLKNGNYVVSSPSWDNGAVFNTGAVTWGSAATGIRGEINESNSLIGNNLNDNVGNKGVTPLTNGNYVVNSSTLSYGNILQAGAVTFGNGVAGVTGKVSLNNSLIGSSLYDQIGSTGISALKNGNYVVSSPYWDNNFTSNAGAVTWGNGETGVSGFVDINNSLVGTSVNDEVGNRIATPLSNGHYVVSSPFWNSEFVEGVGAVTWCNGYTGGSGAVTSENSLTGSTSNDMVGLRSITALSNGNYVVNSTAWNKGSIVQVGAITLLDGNKTFTGKVSNSNSLTGGHPGDQIGSGEILALPSGNFVISSPNWDNQEATDAGAVTWVNGIESIVGEISAENSLVGTSSYDQIGNSGVSVISDGNYVVRSTNWKRGTLNSVGAVTWGSGHAGVRGVVNSNNSLVGTYANDRVGLGLINAQPYGYYAILNPYWNNLLIADAGAYIFASSSTGVSGEITDCNSVLGLVPYGGIGMNAFYNTTYGYSIIGQPSGNSVSIFKPSDLSISDSHALGSIGINGLAPATIKTNTDCRIIANIVPNSGNPVNGLVNASVWIESGFGVYVGQPYVTRHYQITPSINPLSSTARVTLYFTQQEFDDFNNNNLSVRDLPTTSSDSQGKANLRVIKFNGTSNNGTGLPESYVNGKATIDPVDNDIVWNSSQNRWEITFDVTGFSGFFIQTDMSPLPVKLVSFEASLVENKSIVAWKIAEAINFSHFEVEKSQDGKMFKTIGKVKFFDSTFSYQLCDIDPFQQLSKDNVVYYRLKMNDIDGTFGYSRIISLKGDNVSNDSRLYVYPNPFSGSISVNFKNGEGEKASVTLLKINGDKVFSEDVIITKNRIELNLVGNYLLEGIYLMIIQTESGTYSAKVVRQRN